MVSEAWRVLASGGLFFARLASNIGLESQLGRSPGRVRLPDGSIRFVVTEALLYSHGRPGWAAASSIRSKRPTCSRCGR